MKKVSVTGEMHEEPEDPIEALKYKMGLEEDEEKFKAFKMAVTLVAACFDKGGLAKGVLLVEKGNKVNIISMNSDLEDTIEMTGCACERMIEVKEDMEENMSEDRVLN